ncbi:MAG: hypothetical protein ACTTI6_07670 [Treponema sp.]|uniref:hypothetical protein n=1 Tax=Treponema sp. TaxID=166 RepID=UPI003FA26864
MSKAETEKTEAVEKETTIGLERFLQLEPQKHGIIAILRSKYAAEIHLKAEWETIIKTVLNRKVK